MKILAIDTASARCSAALHCDGQLYLREADTARTHVQLILPMIDSLLAEAGVSLRQLTGIAFGRGPGSFTGVRIAAAVTQGLALGADLPVLPISDLRALAAQARRSAASLGTPLAAGQVLACMDARMSEVYSGAFLLDDSGAMPALTDEYVGPAATAPRAAALPVVAAIGMGIGAYPSMLAELSLAACHVFAQAEPHAQDMLQLALADLAAGAVWVDAAAAQPVYLRNQVAKIPV